MLNWFAKWLLLSIILLPITLSAQEPEPSGKIAFASNRNGSFQIYVMNADGSNVVQITTEPAEHYYPIWSPDGTYIAFITALEDALRSLNVMKLDGLDVAQLYEEDETTQFGADQFGIDLRWSPDSQRLIFRISYRGNAQGQLSGMGTRMVNADGSDLHQVVFPELGNIAEAQAVRWMPDGRIVAVMVDNVLIAQADGSNTQTLTDDPMKAIAISPNGDQILLGEFVGAESARGPRVDIMNMDRSERQQVIEFAPQTFLYNLFWSPSGNQVLATTVAPLESDPSTNAFQNVVFDVDGSDFQIIPGQEDGVSWSPDGRYIAYYAVPEGRESAQVFRFDVETGGSVQLTDEGYNAQPSWGGNLLDS